MPYNDRKALLAQIETLRGGRHAVVVANFDRHSVPTIPGLTTPFHSDVKEAVFRVLKETKTDRKGIDVILYTRGGEVNAVWPIVSILREFDEDFEVLIPFRCHSAGTLLTLGARRITMTPLAELSPIDPSTGNHFNPPDPTNKGGRLGISVEDVTAYKSFICSQFALTAKDRTASKLLPVLQPSLLALISKVHPIALGNVHRVHQQIKKLANALLRLHGSRSDRAIDNIIDTLTTGFFSHLHMINRVEAQKILGSDHVQFASSKLADALDKLLRQYEDDFAMRQTFFLQMHMGDEPVKEVRLIGGAAESKEWSYLFETVANVRQQSTIPPQVQVQLPAGQPMPLITGLPREINVDLKRQGWARNKEPQGVTR